MKARFLATALAMGFAGTAQATSVTIDFSVSSNQILPYSEDGFSLTGNELDGASGSGNFDPFGIAAGSFYSSNTFIGGGLTNGGLRIGEGADFKRDGGGLFTLESFKHRSAQNAQSTSPSQLADAFDILGFRNGLLVIDYGNFSTDSATLITEAINDSTLIDTLAIVGTQVSFASPIWDDFVFNTHVAPIPLPTGLPLLAGGLVALGTLRRKRRS
jgi:hypothetical protein